jgi:hypothetical protein
MADSRVSFVSDVLEALTVPPQRNETSMADKSPRQHQSKKAGKTLKEKRLEKKAKQATSKPLLS